MSTPTIKLLIADAEGLNSRRLAEYVCARGFEARVVTKVDLAIAEIDRWRPRFVLVDLTLAGGGALRVIDHVRRGRGLNLGDTAVLVASAHNDIENVRGVIARGARDYLVKPFAPEDALARFVHHVRALLPLGPALAHLPGLGADELMLELTDLVLREATRDADLEEILFNLTRMVNLRLGAVRCSLVHVVDEGTGVVVTSGDNREARGVRLDLRLYPEVTHVMNANDAVAIASLADAPELRAVRERTRDITFDAMVLAPVARHDRAFGVLSVRLPAERTRVTDAEVRFVKSVARVITLVLNGQRHQAARDFWDRPEPRGILNFRPKIEA